jgi:hypothetical protein
LNKKHIQKYNINNKTLCQEQNYLELKNVKR